jgi:hypothetical protein
MLLLDLLLLLGLVLGRITCWTVRVTRMADKCNGINIAVFDVFDVLGAHGPDVPSFVAMVTGSSFDPLGKGDSMFSSIYGIGAALIILHIVGRGLVFYIDANSFPFLGSEKF